MQYLKDKYYTAYTSSLLSTARLAHLIVPLCMFFHTACHFLTDVNPEELVQKFENILSPHPSIEVIC